MDDEQRQGITNEFLNDKIDKVLELVVDVPKIKDIVLEHGERLDRIERRLIVVESIVTEHSADLKEHTADLKEIKQILGGTVDDVAELKLTSHTH